MRRLLIVLLSTLLAVGALPTLLSAAAAADPLTPAGAPQTSTYDPGPELYDHVAKSDIPVKMRDGRVLRATVYTPTVKGTQDPAPGKFPVILVQTPYGKTLDGVGVVGTHLINRGYLGVVVDVAGTGGSEGQSMLFGETEAKDGVELVHWAASLPKANGKVGLLGGSYLGIDQMFTAAEVGPNSPLKAIFPIVTSVDPYRDLFVSGGLVNLESSVGLLAIYAGVRTLSPLVERGPVDPLHTLRLVLEHALATIPFEATVGVHALLHTGRAYDGPYWRKRAPQRVLRKIVRNRIPAYFVGGQYDVFQRGQPLLYSGLQNAFRGRSVWRPMRPNQKPTPRYQLRTGPWDHGNTGGGFDMPRVQLAWFDRWLKNKKTGILATKTPLHIHDTTGPVYGLAGYPDRRATPTAFHLQPGGGLAESAPKAQKGASTLVWKGLTLSCQRSIAQWGAGALRDIYDQCKKFPALAQPQPGDAAFETAPMKEPLTLAGPVGLRLQMTSTQAETMVVATLQDVAPDGSITDITAGSLLGSARKIAPAKSWRGANGSYQLPFHPHTRAAETPVPRGKVVTHDIELRPAYSTLKKGHRLRLVLQTGDTPHLLPPVAKALQLLGGIYRVQTNAVTPSFLSLPILDRAP